MKPRTKDDSEVNITEIHLTDMKFYLLGTSALVPHAMSFKSQGSLLFPSGRKTAAEKVTTMKHDPYPEFRDAAYKFKGNDQPTRLYMPGGSFHRAMADAAIDMVGAKKAEIGRLTNIVEEKVGVWGVPEIYCSVVRSSDMARTPDIRTLPILKKWAAIITVQFVSSLIKPASVANLIGAAGVIIGVGDGRPQKGKLSFGKFRVVDANNPELLQVMKFGGLKAQDQALANPDFHDLETQQLLEWFEAEKKQRIAAPAKAPAKEPKAKAGVIAKAKGRRNGKEALQ